MVPDGRLFVADRVQTGGYTIVYDAALNYLQHFVHPQISELSPFGQTTGVTYDPRTGTLWWLNMETTGFEVFRTMLLEGSVSGVPTGRRIILDVPTGNAPAPGLYGGVLEPAQARFYAVDVRTGVDEALWAVDIAGAVVDGFPLALARYPTAEEGSGIDAHGGLYGLDEVRVEVPVAVAGEANFSRVVVSDPAGQDLGLETPVPAFPAGWRAGLRGTALRSRIDPNGVMYGAFSGFDAQNLNVRGLFAFRPIPLSPRWLTLSHWMGTIPAGGTSELELTFRAGQREPGEYHSTLVVEDTSGEVLASVPLTMVVEVATPASEPGAEEAGVRLDVSPNPVRQSADVSVTMARPAHDVHVTVHDVLGRVVETRHVASLPQGTTTVPLDAAGLPAGVYVVRAAGADWMATTRFSVVR
jgi:hypothetical protein